MVDYYRTRFHLARAEILQSAVNLSPLEADALELDDMHDLSSRVSCFAWLHATLRSIPGVSQLKDDLGIGGYVESETRKSLEQLLRESTEHVEVVRPLAKALAGTDDFFLCELIEKVNTIARRDACYRLAAEYSRSNAYWKPSLESAKKTMQRYESLATSVSAKQRIQRDFIAWAARAAKAGRLDGEIDVEVLTLAVSLHDLVARTNAVSELVSSGKLANDSGIHKIVKSALGEAVQEAETPARKRTISYIAASALIDIDRPFAMELYHEAGGARVSPDHGEALRYTTMIALKSYASLVRMRAASEQDTAKAKVAIEKIESPIVRCELAANLATSISGTDMARAREFANVYVRQVVQEFHRNGQLQQPAISALVAEVAPALWLHHSAYTAQLLASLEPENRDDAYGNILRFIIFGRTVGEPFQIPSRKSIDISEESISEALTVLEAISVDDTFSSHSSSLLSAMRDKANQGRISKVQSAEFRRRITKMAQEKLPATGGIPHDGYLVLALAENLACEKSTNAEWTPLIDRARALPNLADAAFVCAALTGIIPSRNVEARRKAFDASAELIPQLPLIEDRVDRSEVLLKEAWDLNPDRCKQIARSALEASLSVDRGAVRERRLSLIEVVHRFDEELAAALASIVEKEKKAFAEGEELKERLMLLKLGQSLAGRDNSDEVEKQELDALVQGCVRSLALVNGGMAVQASMPELRVLLLRAGGMALPDALGLHAYVIEACYRRYRATREGPEYARALFDAYFGALNLVTQLHEHMEQKDQPVPALRHSSSNSGRFVVGPGTRHEAIEWIKKWIADVRPADLLIVDPYFGSEELQALDLIQQQQPECAVTIVTTSKVNPKQNQHRFNAHWKSISLGAPPDTQVIVVSSDTDLTSELHDRWWIADRHGLTFGTSFNSLGDKLSEIHVLDAAACAELRAELQPYISMRRRSASGARLSYEVFGLQ